MRIQEYPFQSVQCIYCGWDDGGELTLTPAEPGDEDYAVAPELSATRCGRCDEPLAHDTVVPRRRRKPFPPRPRKPIRDRGHRCARVGVV